MFDLDKIRLRANEGRQAAKDYRVPIFDTISVALFILALPLALALA